MAASVLRYAAFTDVPGGGNSAGVVLDASGLADAEMLAVAAGVGYSETAFPRRRGGEDPATGAAAAAFGAYLREVAGVRPPATVTILQGEDLGRPGVLLVGLHPDRAEIDVTGTAVEIPGAG